MNFYIDVGNNGPDVSEDTKLTFSDNIFDLTFESVSFSKGELDEVLPVWNIGTLEVEEEVMLDFEGILNETGEDITLTATISGSGFDPNLENNVLVKIIETHDVSDTMLVEVDQGGVAIQTHGVTVEWREEGGEWSGESNILTSGEGIHQIEIRITEILEDYYDYRYIHFAPVNWVDGRVVGVIKWFETNLVSCKFRFNDDFYMPPVAPRSERWDEMFSECNGFTGGGLSSWETSHVSSMQKMFYDCQSLNADLSLWDVSGVQDMVSMFYRCYVFNSDLSAWDTRSVKSFARTFEHCHEFNSNLSLWNTSECTNMYLMFCYAGKYNQPMGDWDTSNVTDMYGMFERCTAFNQDISSWDVRKVSRERMASMFRWANSFNQDLSSWCVSHIAQEPLVFKTNADSWTLPKPIWGTCPQEDDPTPVEGFVIKTSDGVVAAIEGTGEVPGTGVYVEADGQIFGQSQLEEVVSWPEEKPDWLESDGVVFYQTANLTKVPDTLPTWITDMTYMFRRCSNFNQDLSGWDTSNVTSMESTFQGCSSFNGDISGWDTSNVTTMETMFTSCESFNQDISGWDVSNVTTMRHMFSSCSNFNQDLSGWDTSNVTSMESTFQRCSSFNGDISGWDTSNVTTMDAMFSRCSSFNQDISGWDVSNVVAMHFMFTGCSNFNQDLSGWCVSNIPRTPDSFSYEAFSWTLPKPVWGTCPQGDDPTPVGDFVIKTTDGAVLEIEGTGTVPGTNVYVHEDGRVSGGQLEEVLSFPEEKPDWLEGNGIRFYSSAHLTKVPDILPAWITDMSSMFGDCSNFNQDLSGWDTSNVTDMSYMFSGCTSFNQDISGWDTSNVTNMNTMFQDCTSLNQDLSGWDVSSVTDMRNMFSRCSSFNGDLSGWDTSNVDTMYAMFYGCSGFNGDLSGWDISNVTNMTMMFRGCSSFNQDLSGWCVSNFPSEPFNFSDNTPSWTLPKPIWGTCPQEDNGEDDLPSEIGQAFGGGYYIGNIEVADGGADDGIYAVIMGGIETQYEDNLAWKLTNTPTTGTESMTNGLANSLAMQEAGLSDHPAAEYCLGFSNDFDDWYLPSIGEWELAWINRDKLSWLDLGQAFWSSSHHSEYPDSAWYKSTGNGYQDGVTKTSGYRVRPVRRIPFTP